MSAAVATIAAILLGVAAPAQADATRDLEYWLTDYGFPQAWQVSRGKGITVAVIDTGIASGVADLGDAVTGGADMSKLGSSDGRTPVGTESDHGTFVASLLAGRGTGPNTGVIGVAPAVNLLSISVAFGNNTGSLVSTDDQIARGVVWAVDHGAQIINMSLTRNTPDWPPSWDQAFSYAFSHNVIIVAAAGNRADGTSQVGAPATIPGVLTVAGVNRAKYASFDASSQGITVAVAAPSEDLVGVEPNGTYARWSGTSGAAPLVSGLLALVWAANPSLDANNVMNRVLSTANPNGHPRGGPIYGNGLIDPVRALTASVPHVDANPLGSLDDWIRVHRRAALAPQTPAPEQSITPQADPALPRHDQARTLLPTTWTLQYVTVPLALVTAFAILAALVGLFVTRQFQRAARKRSARQHPEE